MTRAKNRLNAAAHLSLAEMIVDARSGKFTEACARAERDRAQIEGAFVVSYARLYYLVYAFARAQAGLREPADGTRWLDLARTAKPGALAFAGAKWPEMATYLKEHGL